MTIQILNEKQGVLERRINPSSLQKNNWLQGLDLPEIVNQYSTPLYITNQAQLLRNLNEFEMLLGGHENIYFPIKASPCLAIFELLAAQGCGADCASQQEIQLACLSGIPAARLSYYSPAPDIALAAMLLHEGGSVVIDSPSKLKLLEDHLGEVSFPGKLFLRVNPLLYGNYSLDANYQQYTAHGNLSSQFGLPSEEVISFLTSTKLSFSGLHIHVGTQMDNVEIFQESVDTLHELCDLIHGFTDHQISELNLGGGLGIPAHDGEDFPFISELAASLKPKFRPEFTYKMEPGNALFGDATALITRVVTRKSSRGKGWAIVDVGTDQLLKVTLAGFSQDVLRADGTPLPRTGLDSIAGPLCFAGDILLPETDLTGVEEEDLLLLPNVGAYCRAVGNHFNGRLEPGTLIVNDSHEIGLAYAQEETFWQPMIQSFRPEYLRKDSNSKIALSIQHVEKLRSVYLKTQCANDTYSFHEFTRVSRSHYEVTIEVESVVAFISAPLVMRIISDAVIVATMDELGQKEKNISVWGSRFAVSLDSILRTKRRHRLGIHLSPLASSSDAQKRELIAFWNIGEGSFHGSIRVLV